MALEQILPPIEMLQAVSPGSICRTVLGGDRDTAAVLVNLELIEESATASAPSAAISGWGFGFLFEPKAAWRSKGSS